MGGPENYIHALWRPQVGLALWFGTTIPEAQPNIDFLPAAIAHLVSGRSLRRTFNLPATHLLEQPLGPVASLTIGPERAVEILTADTTTAPYAGDYLFYRQLVKSLDVYITAGFVVPNLNHSEGESSFRWNILDNINWRNWFQNMYAVAPPLLKSDKTALIDFCNEITDILVRRRLVTANPHSYSSAVSQALLTTEATTTKDLGAAAVSAWTQWAESIKFQEALLILRLTQPETDQPYWQLQVCRRTATEVTPVEIRTVHPHVLDEITSDLARAASLFAELKSYRTDPNSLNFWLTEENVIAFLATGAKILTDARIEVLLPISITYVRPSLAIRGPFAPESSRIDQHSVVGLAEMQDFHWQLALGDIVLSDQEMATISRSKSGLVNIRGKWVYADAQSLTAAAQFIESQRALRALNEPLNLIQLIQLAANADPEATPVPISRIQNMGWLDALSAGAQLQPTTRSIPTNLVASLRDYQHRGFEWLHYLSDLGVGAILADDMGLGKTIQVLTLLASTAGNGPTLIVCPMSVVGNWQREATQFTPDLRVHIHHGGDRERGINFTTLVETVDIVVTSFSIMDRDHELLQQTQWSYLIVDEAQHVKNSRTKQARSLRTLTAKNRIALTGTPVENRLEDLRSLMDLVNPGLLGSPSTFKARYAIPIERERDSAALARLKAITSPFILRRLKSDPTIISDLPEKVEQLVRANLSTEQAALYQAVLDQLMLDLKDLAGMGRKGAVLATLTQLKQICNHPGHYLKNDPAIVRDGTHRSGKVELLEDILTNIFAKDERVLLFTQFTAFGKLLDPWLSSIVASPIPFLHGGISRTQREQLVTDFSHETGPPLLLASLQTGGTGINLTAANHVVHLDRWWNPAVENQATDRAYRIGQQRRVEVRKFICIGTIEERINSLLTKKAELSELTVGSGENWLTELSNDEIFELMHLSNDAVGD